LHESYAETSLHDFVKIYKTLLISIIPAILLSKLTHAERLCALFVMQQIAIFQIITILRAKLTF